MTVYIFDIIDSTANYILNIMEYNIYTVSKGSLGIQTADNSKNYENFY